MAGGLQDGRARWVAVSRAAPYLGKLAGPARTPFTHLQELGGGRHSRRFSATPTFPLNTLRQYADRTMVEDRTHSETGTQPQTEKKERATG